MEKEIPLEDLVVGDRVIAHQFGRPGELGKTSFKGVVSEIIREPPYRYRGKQIEEVRVWLDTGRGAARDIGLNFTIGSTPQWVFVEDPAVQTKKKARMLTELKRGKTQIPEDLINYELAPMLGLTAKTAKKGGRKTRRRRSTRRR